MARPRERRGGRDAELVLDQALGAPRAESLEGEGPVGLPRGERLEQGLRRIGFARARDDDQGRGHVAQPPREVLHPLERGDIAPVRVVDHEQEGAARGEVRREPVEAVEKREPVGDRTVDRSHVAQLQQRPGEAQFVARGGRDRPTTPP